MALVDDLSAALKEAMKAKDKPKLDAIRQVQTEIAKKKSEKGGSRWFQGAPRSPKLGPGGRKIPL